MRQLPDPLRRLCPFCVQRLLTRFHFSSFFNASKEPFVRAIVNVGSAANCSLARSIVAAGLLNSCVIVGEPPTILPINWRPRKSGNTTQRRQPLLQSRKPCPWYNLVGRDRDRGLPAIFPRPSFLRPSHWAVDSPHNAPYLLIGHAREESLHGTCSERSNHDCVRLSIARTDFGENDGRLGTRICAVPIKCSMLSAGAQVVIRAKLSCVLKNLCTPL